jgi:hypothetical protein
MPSHRWVFAASVVFCLLDTTNTQPTCIICPLNANCDGSSVARCKFDNSTFNAATCNQCTGAHCASGTYLFPVACNSTFAGTCRPCQGCPFGQRRQGCGLLAEGTCVACTACASGQYRVSCTGVAQDDCRNCNEGCALGIAELLMAMIRVCMWLHVID